MTHELTINVTADASALITGTYVTTGYWSGGLDHAALVTASRSRADAYDAWLYRVGTSTTVGMVAVSGANSTALKIGFNLVAQINAFATDSSYRLVFGDLGQQVSRFTAAAGSGATDAPVVVAAVASAVSLPAPGFPLGETRLYDVREATYPEAQVTRRGRTNGNARRRFSCRWTAVSAEDWYEVRAFLRAQKGGASSFTAPSWLNGGSGTFQIVPDSVTLTQESRRSFMAEATIEEAPV